VRLVVHWQHPASAEDYLQEFGRAGRDGKPALALIFTRDDKDVGLLKWMAERSAEEVVDRGRRTDEEARKTLDGRMHRIDEMNTLVEQTDRCFRAELLEVLQGPRRRRRRSLARWLLDIVFSSHPHVEHAGACCDRCQPELVKRIRAGAYTPGERLTRRLSLDWRALWRRLLLPLAGLLALAIVLGTFDHQHGGASIAEQAVGTYETYVARHEPGHSFTTPHVRRYRGYQLACAEPHQRSPTTLCLLIRPDVPPARAVVGAYHRRGPRHFACTGVATRLRIC
jgi:hypothetical protein